MNSISAAPGRIRAALKRMPGSTSMIRMLRATQSQLLSRKKVFRYIHDHNIWGSPESVSGIGSDSVQTANIRQALPALWKRLGVVTLLDAPCGDFHWMREIVCALDSYIGIDIVPALILENNTRYASHRVSFLQIDLVDMQLPASEMVLCRDCLVHLSHRDALRALRNIRHSGAEYLLTTTFSSRDRNVDILTGEWRPLNLELEPFFFPRPLELINEGCTERNGEFADKSLGLWRLADLPLD